MNSNGVGDVLEFPDPFIILSVYTDEREVYEGFELEIEPLEGKNTVSKDIHISR